MGMWVARPHVVTLTFPTDIPENTPLYEYDMLGLSASDAAIVDLRLESWGVGMEIERCRMLGLPILLLALNGVPLSGMLNDLEGEVVRYDYTDGLVATPKGLYTIRTAVRSFLASLVSDA